MKTVLIKANPSIVEIETPQGSEVASSIERALALHLPSAPPAMIHGAAEILESLLGPLDHPEVHTGVVDA